MQYSIIFPLFLLPAAIIGYMYQHFAIGYLNTGCGPESNSRSPIFSGFSEMLEGIVTVQAFRAEQHFLNVICTKINLTVRMFYNFWMLNCHLLLHFNALGSMGVLAATLFSLSSYVSAGTAGVYHFSNVILYIGVLGLSSLD
jgi:ABC-type multidrug transport system fused ATPase/permease subunit